MEPTKPKLPTEAIQLYNLFIHGEISRRDFVAGVRRFAIGGLTAAAVIEALMRTVPIENSKLNENMEFAHHPSNRPSGAQRTESHGGRHGDGLQISRRPPGREPRPAAPTRRAPPLCEA